MPLPSPIHDPLPWNPLQWYPLPWPAYHGARKPLPTPTMVPYNDPPYHDHPTMDPLPWPSPITPYYAPLPCPHTMAPPIMAHTTMIGGLGSGPAHLIILKTLTVKLYILTLFEMIF